MRAFLVVCLVLCLGGIAPARAQSGEFQLPAYPTTPLPRVSLPSAANVPGWLHRRAGLIGRVGEVVVLAQRCGFRDDTWAMALNANFDDALNLLDPAERAYASGVYRAGRDRASGALDADTDRACTLRMTHALRQADALANGQASFWQPPIGAEAALKPRIFSQAR